MIDVATPVSEAELAGLCVALGAERLGRLSVAERGELRGARSPSPATFVAVSDAIARGEDPLGDALQNLRSRRARRALGATFTPPGLVAAMADFGCRGGAERVVDPGAGSGRFLLAAARRLPDAALVGVELDPLAALVCRAALVAAGFAGRARVVTGDYLGLALADLRGRTLFLGNPPYVRHHAIAPEQKEWLARAAAARGLRASRLSGLHVHFALKTSELARPGDRGALLLPGEWLDVNYGALLRELFAGRLGGTRLDVLSPEARAFEDADATAVVACFELGTKAPTIFVRNARTPRELRVLEGGHAVARERALGTPRWSSLTRPARTRPAGYVELGELVRVHRGQVTGNNRVWIAGDHSRMLPAEFSLPAVTRAMELFRAGHRLRRSESLRCVIDLPIELDELDRATRRKVEKFLAVARSLGADRGFIASHRRAWWSVGLREPAPILATYMARRPPAFVMNEAGVRHINVAHGLYPRERISKRALSALARYLARATERSEGRTYAGGLTKFEPREMERLWVPGPALLLEGGG